MHLIMSLYIIYILIHILYFESYSDPKMIFFLILTFTLYQSLMPRTELPKLISSALVENWKHIIFPILSVLFPYTPTLFESLLFIWKPSYSPRMGLSLSKQLMLPEKTAVLTAKFTILIFWSSVFNSTSFSLKLVRTLVTTTYNNMDSGQSWETSYMMRVKLAERRPFILILGQIFWVICIRQKELSKKSRKGNKSFQVTTAKALAKSTGISQISKKIIVWTSLCCSSLVIVNYSI